MTSMLMAPPAHASLDAQADHLARCLLDGFTPDGGWSHERLVLATVALVRQHGPDGAFDLMLQHRPDLHVTRTVFMVWAVGRLVDAGLTTARVLWHPLMDRHSILCWWHAHTLDSHAARTTWVAPTLVGDSEGCRVQPPATAGMIDTVSPSRTGVARPSR